MIRTLIQLPRVFVQYILTLWPITRTRRGAIVGAWRLTAAWYAANK